MSARTLVEPLDRITTGALLVCVGLFALGGFFVLAFIPFPTAYDELQHVSFLAALSDAPTLFPDYGTYRVLNADLQSWSEARNYLAHPPLYYLLLAPFGTHPDVLRVANLAMATVGFALCAHVGVTLLATTAQRLAFLALLILFSKPALIAGMVNNDNLVLLEGGLLFWSLAARPPRIATLGALLAAVGWTKFNAFVGLTVWIGVWHLFAIARREAPIFGRVSVTLSAGVLVGAVPAIANLVTLGTVAYVPVDFLYVTPDARPPYDFFAFTAAFFNKIGQKILFIDGMANMLPLVVVIIGLACIAAMNRATCRARDLAVAALFATLTFAVLHVVYGWTSFRTLGSMSDAQSRYYVMLWPGLALAAALGASTIASKCVIPKFSGLLRRSRSSQ